MEISTLSEDAVQAPWEKNGMKPKYKNRFKKKKKVYAVEYYFKSGTWRQRGECSLVPLAASFCGIPETALGVCSNCHGKFERHLVRVATCTSDESTHATPLNSVGDSDSPLLCEDNGQTGKGKLVCCLIDKFSLLNGGWGVLIFQPSFVVLYIEIDSTTYHHSHS